MVLQDVAGQCSFGLAGHGLSYFEAGFLKKGMAKVGQYSGCDDEKRQRQYGCAQ